MTNKMPVVGKRYKFKQTGELGVLKTEHTDKWVLEMDCGSRMTQFKSLKGDNFFHSFEELPEKPTNAKNAQVEEAKELRKYFDNNNSDHNKLLKLSSNLVNALDEQANKIEKPLADDKSKDDSENVKCAECGEEIKYGEYAIQGVYDVYHAKCDKPKSIWRDVSDFQDLKRRNHVLIKSSEGIRIAVPNFIVAESQNRVIFDDILDGNTEHQVKEYCSLTDFVSFVNSLEERVKKLEGK